MKVYSNYLGREIELPSFDVLEGDKSIPVVSYNALRAAIYGEKECVEGGVQAHYNSVVTEPGHYAFICVISDDAGRRVEGFGESLSATLDTQIAKNYPSLMAAKRAFSDAALLFLGINNAYSDAQISAPKNAHDIPQSAAEYAATQKAAKAETEKKVAETKPATETKPVAEKKPPERKTPKKKAEEPAPAEPAPAEPAPAEEHDFFEDIDALLGENTDDPLGLGDETAPEDMLPFMSEPEPAAEEPATAPAKEPAAPTEKPVAPAEEPAAQVAEFDFDKEIISIGQFKTNPLPVSEAYKARPDSVDWIANKMRSSAPDRIHQQEVCKAYLKSIGK